MTSNIDCAKFLSTLDFVTDVRALPDERRKGRFHAGWDDATVRAQDYSIRTLRQLTWHNLGYRLGKRFGQKPLDEIADIYEQFASYYREAVTPTIVTGDNVDGEVEEYTWETEIRNWAAKRRSFAPELADEFNHFFARAFEETRCPEQAWFGIHSSLVSLVVGGIYLASVVASSADHGVWLLVDSSFPPSEGIDYRPVKSTQSSESPLIWAHVQDIELVSRLTDFNEIWASFAQASEKILQYRIASDRDEQQYRRGKHRLLDFWPPQGEADFSLPDEVDPSVIFYEGARRQIIVNTYERDARARRECIARYKAHCIICEFDFGAKYGEEGAGYIHVHHLRQLSDIGERYQVDPIEDLRPVCPNCHAIIHRRSPPYTIDEMKAMLRRQNES